jgi:hypothetical protein
VLLHELAHVNQTAGYNQNDGKDMVASQANSDLVWQNCSKTIMGK